MAQRELLQSNHDHIRPFTPSFPYSQHPITENYHLSSGKYREAIENLTVVHEDGVTLYTGGPLDLRHRDMDDQFERSEIQDAWLTPIVVRDQEGFSILEVAEFNIKNNLAGEHKIEPVTYFLTASDAELTLQANTPAVQLFNELTSGKDPRPRRIVRVVTSGSVVFGEGMMVPTDIPSADVLANRIARASMVTGIDIPATNEDLTEVAHHQKKPIEIPNIHLEGFTILEPTEMKTPEGTFYLYGVESNDQWKYYELLSPTPLSEFDFQREITIRIDSACDTGQCWGDEGCDCARQLHDAMELAQRTQGLIALCPTQNGRGCGKVTKLATEAGKVGYPLGLYKDHPPMDTVKAAKLLLGPMYDIRSYEGIARLLQQLGVTQVGLFSDNLEKHEALQNVGINTRVIPTETLSKSSNLVRKHLGEKLKTRTYNPNKSL